MAMVLTSEEKDQLLQRYYDGETLGNEAALAEQLLADDPDARAMLDGLRELTDSIRVDVASVVAEEDFTDFWTGIEARLPKGPLTLETGQDPSDVVARPAEPLAVRPRSVWERLWMPALATAACGILLMVALRPGAVPPGVTSLGTTVANNSIVIDELESAGGLVMVQQESADLPAIIWFTESEET